MSNSRCCNIRGSCASQPPGESSFRISSEKSSVAVSGRVSSCGEQVSGDVEHILLLWVHGMDCGGCAADVSSTLSAMKSGILDHSISLADSRLEVTYDGNALSRSKIISAIETAGYSCEEISDSMSDTVSTLKKSKDCSTLRHRFLLAAVCTSILYFFSWLALNEHSLLNKLILPGLYLIDLAACFLVVPMLTITSRIYTSAWSGVRSRRINSNTLIACALTTSLAYSVAAIAVAVYSSAITRPETFFDTVGELITFTLLGRWMETSANVLTTSGITDLLRLNPDKATRIDVGVEEVIDASSLKPSDICLVREDERIPADCKILEGTASIDESAISGDFIPQSKQGGDMVYAGTLNIKGTVTCRVIKIGMDTHIGQTAALLLTAQAKKAKIEFLAESLASLLVPLLMGLSGLTILSWLFIDPRRYVPSDAHTDASRLMLSIKLGISVLVVACPCALTIATPTAVMVGIAEGARHGILIKGASVLETLAKATDIVFDKTGTLTYGRLEVGEVRYAADISEERKIELWHLVQTAEHASLSVHPIKDAIDVYLENQYLCRDISPFDLQIIDTSHGAGLRGTFREPSSTTHTSTLLIGNRHMCHIGDVTLPEPRQNKPDLFSPSHSQDVLGTQIYVTINGEVMCTITFRDVTREDAARTVALLQAMGKTIWMFTGDDYATAELVAGQVGIPRQNVIGDCTISSKADAIRHLRRQNKVVVMIGDGINDVLALTTADVGISLRGATDVATNSADVILMQSGGIGDVSTSVVLAQDVYRKVKYNLAFSVIWNFAVVPLAMGILLPWDIYLPPATAACLMSLSCVSIILSSLMLKNWEAPMPISTVEDLCTEKSQNHKYQASLRKLFRRTILSDTLESEKVSLEV